MSTKRGFAGWRAIALTEEASYNSAATIGAASFTENHESDPIGPIALLEDGTVLIGTEAEEPNEQDVLAWASEGPHEARCRPNTLALFAAFAQGNISHTAIGEPSSGFYTHTITPCAKTFLSAAYTAGTSTEVTVDDSGCFPAAGTVIFEDDGEEWTYDTKTATTFDHATLPSNNHADDVPVHLKENTNTFLLPSMTALDCIGGSHKKQWTGMIVNSLSLSGDRKGWVRISASLGGSGSSTSPATGRPTPIPDESYMKVGDCTVNLSGTWDGRTWTGGTSLNPKIRSFKWDYNNNPDDAQDYLFGSGLYRGRAERGRRSQGLSLDLELENLDQLGSLLDQDALNLQIDMQAAGDYGAKLVFPQFRAANIGRSGGTGIMLESVGAAVQQHATYGSVQLDVFNKLTGYLH